MSKLNLEDWSRLAEICAAVVVILSLGYVALEIEQNTKAVQAASYQALITGLTEVDLAVVTNPELDRVVSLGEKTPAELSAQEWSTFHRYALARTGQFELAFIAFENGALDELQWSGAQVFMSSVFCMPGYHRFFRENSDAVFTPAFAAYVRDEVIPGCDQAD